MNVEEYERQFTAILDGSYRMSPYDSPFYIKHVKENYSTIQHWYEEGQLISELINIIQAIKKPMHWLVITEPWCGDAAQSHAFIVMLSRLNQKINLSFQNRDSDISEIEQYLTNGGKSIPKLIVRDSSRIDVFTWGPRPQAAQQVVAEFKNQPPMSQEEKIQAIMNWYTSDQGVSIQQELLTLFARV